MASANDLCWSCRTYQEITYTEPDTLRSFCKPCAMALPQASEELALEFLMATIPFKVGDKVEARTGGEVFDGVGEITGVFIDLPHGGTPVFPSFHVKLETKAHELAPDDAYYTEICLTKVAA